MALLLGELLDELFEPACTGPREPFDPLHVEIVEFDRFEPELPARLDLDPAAPEALKQLVASDPDHPWQRRRPSDW